MEPPPNIVGDTVLDEASPSQQFEPRLGARVKLARTCLLVLLVPASDLLCVEQVAHPLEET